MIKAAIKRGLIRGIIISLYGLLGYLIAYTIMGGRVL
jgi:hypothetical protein